MHICGSSQWDFSFCFKAVILIERQGIIMKMKEFVNLMTGHFDNREQFEAMKEAGKIYPYAQHVNTV